MKHLAPVTVPGIDLEVVADLPGGVFGHLDLDQAGGHGDVEEGQRLERSELTVKAYG